MKQKLEQYQEIIESFLQSHFWQDPSIPESLNQAMEYSLFAGGKRIRPILCLVWSEVLGQNKSCVLGFATALELIHTYSLIHDDLPAMDDDDYRRGQPSSHVKYGEALAILAGDALLTEAFYLMSKTDLPSDRVLNALKEVAHSAGPRGLVGGQVLDIALTGKGCQDVKTLETMHSLKTGALIRAACLSGAHLAGVGVEDQKRVNQYGASVGLAFQVADDLLDVIGDNKKLGKPTGSDHKNKKLTYPELLGLKESKNWAQRLVEQAQGAIQSYSGEHALFLHDLAQYIIDRIE